MRAFFRDLFDRFARGAVFSNTDNLGEAMRFMQQAHLAEVEQRQIEAARHSVRQVMQRPLQSRRVEQAVSRRETGRPLSQAATQVEFAAVN